MCLSCFLLLIESSLSFFFFCFVLFDNLTTHWHRHRFVLPVKPPKLQKHKRRYQSDISLIVHCLSTITLLSGIGVAQFSHCVIFCAQQRQTLHNVLLSFHPSVSLEVATKLIVLSLNESNHCVRMTWSASSTLSITSHSRLTDQSYQDCLPIRTTQDRAHNETHMHHSLSSFKDAVISETIETSFDQFFLNTAFCLSLVFNGYKCIFSLLLPTCNIP